MTEAIPMVSMVGVSAEMLLVNSATIIINAIGILAMLPKQALIPTITHGVGESPMEGTK